MNHTDDTTSGVARIDDELRWLCDAARGWIEACNIMGHSHRCALAMMDSPECDDETKCTCHLKFADGDYRRVERILRMIQDSRA